jgi:heparanase 1
MTRAKLALVAFLAATKASSSPVEIAVSTREAVVTVPPTFLGFTLDWWPTPENTEGFNSSTVLKIDFSNPRLRALARALGPSTLRVGGSLDNVVRYLVGDADEAWCNAPLTFRGVTYAEGLCLNMSRWAALVDFVETALAPGSALVFGLQLDLAGGEGPYNGTNALAFLEAVAASGATPGALAFELGEETTPGVGTSGFAAYVGAYASVRSALARLWPSAPPALLGPCAGMGDNQPPFTWMSAFLGSALHGPGGALIDGLVMHSYNNDGGGGWVRPGLLNETAVQAAGLRALLDAAAGPAFPLSCGECGPHNGGGRAGITDAAISSFWYLDALLGLPMLGAWHEFGRQTLAGASYALLQNDGFQPNPDYFVALAYARFVGPQALNATVAGGGVELRVYARCARNAGAGAVVLAWINVGSSSFAATVDFEGTRRPHADSRAEYHFTPAGGDVFSRVLLLNGVPLAVPGTEPPEFVPVGGDPATPLAIGGLTLGFAVYPDAGAAACS